MIGDKSPLHSLRASPALIPGSISVLAFNNSYRNVPCRRQVGAVMVRGDNCQDTGVTIPTILEHF